MLADIVARRLHNQRLAGAAFASPPEAVRWLGAVQAQEYLGAKWGLAQRLALEITSAQFDELFSRGEVLRTHVLRPTWHFVGPGDIRWLLALTGPRVKARMASGNRKLGVDEALLSRARPVLETGLAGNMHLTRTEVGELLQQAGLAPGPGLGRVDQRRWLAHLLALAELDGLICSGRLRGKQHTYALLEERVPPGGLLGREKALAELARRYFASHGPATLKDFSWWAGLAVAEARLVLDRLKSQGLAEATNGSLPYYWLEEGSAAAPLPEGQPLAHLLPAYDEYGIAYRDHTAILDPRYRSRLRAPYDMIFTLNGRISGSWQRTLSKNSVRVELSPFEPLGSAQQQALQEAAQRYACFLDLALDEVNLG